MVKKRSRQRPPKKQKQSNKPLASKRKVRGSATSVKPDYDARLEMALKTMREGSSLAAAARKVGAGQKRLRRYVTAMGVVERREGKWHFKRDRRFRRLAIYTDGKYVAITVRDLKTASLVGQFMGAVRRFFESENIELLAPFRDQSIRDVTGKRYVFETRPNVLFRLDASGVEPFELVYAIVKPE